MKDRYIKFLTKEIRRYNEQVIKKDKGKGGPLLF